MRSICAAQGHYWVPLDTKGWQQGSGCHQPTPEPVPQHREEFPPLPSEHRSSNIPSARGRASIRHCRGKLHPDNAFIIPGRNGKKTTATPGRTGNKVTLLPSPSDGCSPAVSTQHPLVPPPAVRGAAGTGMDEEAARRLLACEVVQGSMKFSARFPPAAAAPAHCSDPFCLLQRPQAPAAHRAG